MATSGTAPDLLEPWVTAIFFKRFGMIDPLYPQAFNTVPSTKAFEDTFAVSPLGTFVLKPEGTPISYDDPVQSGRKRVVHSTYALGFRITMEMMEDDQHGIMKRMPEDLADSARNHKENLAWSLFNTAFVATSFTGIPEGDGQARAMCATNHIRLKDGGTSSNRLNPDVAFSVSGLQSAITNFDLTQDDSGRYINLTPKTVIHHPNDRFTVAQVLDSTQEPFTSDNQINAVSASRMGLSSLSVPYLTDTDNWWLSAGNDQHSRKWYNRKDLDMGRDKDSQTRDALFDALYRASVTFEDWRGIVGSAP